MRGNGGRFVTRWLLFGSPCIAAAVTAAGFYAPDPISSVLLSEPYERPFLICSGLLAVVGSAAGGWRVSPPSTLRVVGMLGGAVLGVVGYLGGLLILTMPLALE